MPTLKPRIITTLQPATFEVFSRLAELQGRSRGAVLADLAESVADSMRNTVALLEAAKAAKDEGEDSHGKTLETLRTAALDIERSLYRSVGRGVRQLDWLIEDVHEAEREQRSAAATPKARKKPTKKPR
jgi:hypothetical protein